MIPNISYKFTIDTIKANLKYFAFRQHWSPNLGMHIQFIAIYNKLILRPSYNIYLPAVLLQGLITWLW